MRGLSLSICVYFCWSLWIGLDWLWFRCWLACLYASFMRLLILIVRVLSGWINGEVELVFWIVNGNDERRRGSTWSFPFHSVSGTFGFDSLIFVASNWISSVGSGSGSGSVGSVGIGPYRTCWGYLCSFSSLYCFWFRFDSSSLLIYVRMWPCWLWFGTWPGESESDSLHWVGLNWIELDLDWIGLN